MSSPNMNNVILMGAILTFMSIVFGGTNSSFVSETAHLIMCKVSFAVILTRCQSIRVISLFGLVLSLSGIATNTHRPQGVNLY